MIDDVVIKKIPPPLPPYKEYVSPNTPSSKMILSPEHKAKLKAGREAFILKRRGEKALALALEKEKAIKLTPQEALLLAVEENKLENSRSHVLKVIHKNKKQILDAQIESATGLSYVGGDGATVYKKIPDVRTGEYLLNQLIGKPVESLEVKQVTKLIMDI
jgi:predicted peptidase